MNKKKVYETEQQQQSPEERAGRQAKYFLSLRQRRAIPILLSAPTLSEGARRAGVSRSQLNRWFKDPDFVDEFERQSNEIVSRELSFLKSHAPQAVSAWVDCLHSKDDKVKLMAAKDFFHLATTPVPRREQRLDTETALIDAKYEGYFCDRAQAMVETAKLNLPSTYRVVSMREPLLWQRILFSKLNHEEWLNLFEKAGAMDIIGIQESALLCLGALASLFHPDIEQLYTEYLDMYGSQQDDEEILQLQNALKQRLRSFDVPHSEDVGIFVDMLRESARKNLHAEPVTFGSLCEEEEYDLWEEHSVDDDGHDPGPDFESPSSPEPDHEAAQDCIDQDSSAKQDGQPQYVHGSSDGGTNGARGTQERHRLRRRFTKRPISEDTPSQE